MTTKMKKVAIEGYEGRYTISDDGHIFSSYINKEIAQYRTTAGYIQATLWNGNKKRGVSVHRLVAESFIPNPDGKSTVNHKNGIKTDNRAENLEWASQSENTQHAFRILGRTHTTCKPVIQLTKDDVLVAEYKSAWDASRSGYDRSCVAACCRGERNEHRGFLWRFKDIEAASFVEVSE